MPNDLQHAANLTAAELRAVRSRIDGLNDRATALDRILDAYRMAGVEPDDTVIDPEPELPARTEFAQQVVDATIASSNESGRRVAPRPRAATNVAQLPTPKITDRATVDYAEVARIAAAARSAGRPMGPAVAEYYGIKSSTADMRIRQARLNGHGIPTAGARRGRPKQPTVTVRPPAGEPWTADHATAAIEQAAG